jgi:4-aminobutyrate aminotransferase
MSRALEYLKREERVIGKIIGIRFYPIVVEGALGSRVFDVDGKEYIDFSSQWAVVNLGHNHPEVIEAVRSQLERLVFSSHTTFPNTVAIELAERLVELTPGSFEKKVWFGLTGSDANELIYKIMPVYSRRRMLGFQGSYHGQTMGALSLSGHKALTRFIGFPNVVKAPLPILLSPAIRLHIPVPRTSHTPRLHTIIPTWVCLYFLGRSPKMGKIWGVVMFMACSPRQPSA